MVTTILIISSSSSLERTQERRVTTAAATTEISKYPTDFKLFVVGEFDEDSGSLLPLTAPESLGLASEYKRDSGKALTPSQLTGVGNSPRSLVDASAIQ